MVKECKQFSEERYGRRAEYGDDNYCMNETKENLIPVRSTGTNERVGKVIVS